MCGSDGNIYASECQMRETACHKQTEITIQPIDACEGTNACVISHLKTNDFSLRPLFVYESFYFTSISRYLAAVYFQANLMSLRDHLDGHASQFSLCV